MANSGLNANHVRDLVIVPALVELAAVLPGANSAAAVNLLLSTAAAETNLVHLAQHGGPALGIYQIEPDTHQDLHTNWLPQSKYESLREHLGDRADDALIYDLRYATKIARCIYARRPEPLPAADDAEALGDYWLAHYNTAGGAGTLEHFLKAYEAVRAGLN